MFHFHEAIKRSPLFGFDNWTGFVKDPSIQKTLGSEAKLAELAAVGKLLATYPMLMFPTQGKLPSKKTLRQVLAFSQQHELPMLSFSFWRKNAISELASFAQKAVECFWKKDLVEFWKLLMNEVGRLSGFSLRSQPFPRSHLSLVSCRRKTTRQRTQPTFRWKLSTLSRWWKPNRWPVLARKKVARFLSPPPLSLELSDCLLQGPLEGDVVNHFLELLVRTHGKETHHFLSSDFLLRMKVLFVCHVSLADAHRSRLQQQKNLPPKWRPLRSIPPEGAVILTPYHSNG